MIASSGGPGRPNRIADPATHLLIFGSAYVFSFFVLTRIPALSITSIVVLQWVGLISVSLASSLIRLLDRSRWDLGFGRSLPVISRSVIEGVLLASLILLLADLAIQGTTDLTRSRGAGAPDPAELVLLLVPAVLHEELLFRGYLLQKLAGWSVPWAIAVTSLSFAGLHLSNDSMTVVSFVNLVLGGVLLAIARFSEGGLWLPVAIHLAWNFMAGPVLGHELSGYVPQSSYFVLRDQGPAFLTGGSFGIEGSLWMTLFELAGCVYLIRRLPASWRGPAGLVQRRGA